MELWLAFHHLLCCSHSMRIAITLPTASANHIHISPSPLNTPFLFKSSRHYRHTHMTSLISNHHHSHLVPNLLHGLSRIRTFTLTYDLIEAGFWVVDFVVAVWNRFAFRLLVFSNNLAPRKKVMKLTKPTRNLEEYVHDENDNGNIGVFDYLPTDPVPSSKATSIRPGPIEHGTPLMPYIPKPTPPSPGPNESESKQIIFSLSKLDDESFWLHSTPGKCKRYYNVPAHGVHQTQPFSLILPQSAILACERPAIEPSTNRSTSYEVLESGMILMKNYISLMDQRMCFGQNWDPETRYKERYRGDGSELPPVPEEFIPLVETTIQDAQAHINSNVEIPLMRPDVCLVNFYTSTGRLGLHQDRDESPNSLRRGLPVVSISIGDSAEFLYGFTHTTDENNLRKVLLESGDVLIFGGYTNVGQNLEHEEDIYRMEICKEWWTILEFINIGLKSSRLLKVYVDHLDFRELG
ncbi:hypothetical protein L1987_66424 [Smallanthus sonchifolius]|uniref:Uncharacterized protein n=1 Tax=Smallanthus sonchifolius TaxID=185202 RepID=A0ACB9BX94_9ASTR|nr:hypothetical protein L1987_66424 [Smallanthus sonchifolius]